MEYIRQWKVGDQTFESKADAQRYEAEMALHRFGTVDSMIANADEVIALLRPFATPKTRKPKGNGAQVAAPKAKAKSADAQVSA